MTDAQPKNPIGAIISADLTVPNADEVRDFYKAVIGWDVENMALNDDDGAYNDYVMKDSDGNWRAGVCHARGVNLGIPAQWIVYINVADVAASVQSCLDLGGSVVKTAHSDDGTLYYAMIKDPAGAVLALTRA